jgi:AcrR family transcriptional regulator
MVQKQPPLRPRGRPRAYDPDVALAQAMDTFWHAGYAGTSLDDLSAATGMNRPSLYAAFGDKRALYLALSAIAPGPSGAERDPCSDQPLRQTLRRAPRRLRCTCPVRRERLFHDRNRRHRSSRQLEVRAFWPRPFAVWIRVRGAHPIRSTAATEADADPAARPARLGRDIPSLSARVPESLVPHWKPLRRRART